MEILFLSLLLILFFSLLNFNFDLLSPPIVTCLVFIVSVGFVLLLNGYIDKNISLYTIFIILVGVLCFVFGSCLAYGLIDNSINEFENKKEIVITNKTLFIAIIFQLVILILTYKQILNISIKTGFDSYSNGTMLQYARYGILGKGYNVSSYLSIGGFICRGMAYIFLYIFLYNYIYIGKKRRYVFIIIPVLLYLILYSLSGSRGHLIEFIAYTLILLSIFLQKKGIRFKTYRKKIIKYCFIFSILFVFAFYFLGLLKGGSDQLFKIFASYAGGSIKAFDKWLSTFHYTFSSFNNECFLGIENLLYKFGIIDGGTDRILEFTAIGNGVTTNIYTAFRRYISDFGIIGLIIIQFISGFFYMYFYKKILKIKRSNYIIVLFGIMYACVVYQSIDDQLTTSFLSITQIMTVLFTYLFYLLLIKKNILGKKIKIKR